MSCWRRPFAPLLEAQPEPFVAGSVDGSLNVYRARQSDHGVVRSPPEYAAMEPPLDERLGANDPAETCAGSLSYKGTTLGQYRLLQCLGEGGMGEVWLAEQMGSIRRQVAVKVIKAGMDSTQVIARFEAERQALAVMDHPSIAKVFDGGKTPEGRPYFAMEYVRGEAITRYCHRRRLSLRARLELVIQLCEGVQHAHQKGIIHRDLKPSNVLVAEVDDHPVPRIIDFGIAKAVWQPLSNELLVTEIGGFVGTPEYMSPEQAEVTPIDIDTRSDVYSLGVLLYELLAGTLPFDAGRLRQVGVDEIRRTGPRTRRSEAEHESSRRWLPIRDSKAMCLRPNLPRRFEEIWTGSR